MRLLVSSALLLMACGARLDADRATHVGLYESGFEVSAFQPCGSDESWWLVGNEDFNGRYNVLRVADSTAKSYGPIVLVEIEGDVSPRGRYGHLGASPRQIVVTRTLRMERVDSADACR